MLSTAAEMRAAVLEEFERCTAVVMAAAVSDYHAVEAAALNSSAAESRWNYAWNPIRTF